MSAFIGSRNLGDEAIFRSILHQIDRSGLEITAASINEPKTQQRFGVKTIFAKKFPQLTEAIRECDVMLVGGGGIIQDQSSILNFFYYAFQLWYAQRHHKPIVLNFVGVGPLKFSVSRWVLRRLTPKIQYAIVRDRKSQQQLIACGMDRERIYVAHDPVLNFPYSEVNLTTAGEYKTPYAVVSLRRWFFTNPFLPVFITRNLNRLKLFRRRYDRYMNQLAADFDAYLNNHPEMNLVMVSLYDGEDDIVSAGLKGRMKRADQVVLAPNGMEEPEYLSIVQNANFVIGMRLHSLILASTLAKPFVALRYSTKVDEFTEQMGLRDYSIHVEHYDSKQLQSGLQAVTEQAASLSVNVAASLKAYRAENDAAFARLNKEIHRALHKKR